MRLPEADCAILDLVLGLLIANLGRVVLLILLVIEGPHNFILRLREVVMVGPHFNFLLVLLVLDVRLNGLGLERGLGNRLLNAVLMPEHEMVRPQVPLLLVRELRVLNILVKWVMGLECGIVIH